MGPGGNCDEIKVLNWTLRLTPERLTYESDPKHVDLLASSMGLTVSNAVSTPGTTEPNADYEATKTDDTTFQSGLGDNDGCGRQQRSMDAVQCNRVSMVKNTDQENRRDMPHSRRR